MTENTIMMIVWVSVFLIALVVELSTEALVSIWFSIGALFALAITYIPGTPWWLELIVFLLISILSLALIRHYFKKHPWKQKERMNVDSLVGKKGRVTKTIPKEDEGEVMVDGILWTAESKEEILKGSRIEIISVVGNKVVVKKA